MAYSVLFGTCLLCVGAVLSLSETKNIVMEDTLEKAGSKSSLLSSLSASLGQRPASRRSSSQARIIIDLDTDLIHHRSYSEFDDENEDDDDDAHLDEEDNKKLEGAPLLQRGHQMYDPALASAGQGRDELDAKSNRLHSELDAVYNSNATSGGHEDHRGSTRNRHFDHSAEQDFHQPSQSINQVTDMTAVKISDTDTQTNGNVTHGDNVLGKDGMPSNKNYQINRQFVREY